MTEQEYLATVGWQANEVRRCVEALKGMNAQLLENQTTIAQHVKTIEEKDEEIAALKAKYEPVSPPSAAAPAVVPVAAETPAAAAAAPVAAAAG